MDNQEINIEYKVFEYQSEIIRLQNEVIAGLISVVKQYVDDQELEGINRKIQTTSELCRKIEG